MNALPKGSKAVSDKPNDERSAGWLKAVKDKLGVCSGYELCRIRRFIRARRKAEGKKNVRKLIDFIRYSIKVRRNNV